VRPTARRGCRGRWGGGALRGTAMVLRAALRGRLRMEQRNPHHPCAGRALPRPQAAGGGGARGRPRGARAAAGCAGGGGPLADFAVGTATSSQPAGAGSMVQDRPLLGPPPPHTQAAHNQTRIGREGPPTPLPRVGPAAFVRAGYDVKPLRVGFTTHLPRWESAGTSLGRACSSAPALDGHPQAVML
jgi:hypothetical protein